MGTCIFLNCMMRNRNTKILMHHAEKTMEKSPFLLFKGEKEGAFMLSTLKKMKSVAIRMMRYLPGEKRVLRFTVGRSVKEAMLDSMHNAAHEMEIEGLRSRWLFELDEGIFRALSAEESRKLGYGRGL